MVDHLRWYAVARATVHLKSATAARKYPLASRLTRPSSTGSAIGLPLIVSSFLAPNRFRVELGLAHTEVRSEQLR